MKKCGFTLAETLITLVIIGVVAALTIPNMIARHQKREIEVGLQKTYAELSNWYKMAENDFGPFDTWDVFNLSIDSFVNKYAYPYMKLTKCTKTTKCFVSGPPYVGYYKPTATKEPGELYSFLGEAYRLPDGRMLHFFVGGLSDWNPPGKYMDLCADVNGPKGRSVLGQDIFCFHINNWKSNPDRGVTPNTLYPLGAEIAPAVMSNHNFIMDNAGKNFGILLQRNGWKFPDNYPIKF